MKVKESRAPNRGRLDPENYRILKEKLKSRKQILKKLPMLTLTEFGEGASLSLPLEERVPLEPSDIQSLLMYAVAGDQASIYPFQWCRPAKWNNLSQVAVIIIENISVNDYEGNKAAFEQVTSIFDQAVEVLNPLSDGLTFAQELAYVPASGALKAKIMAGYTSLAEAKEAGAIVDAPSLFRSPTASSKATNAGGQQNNAAEEDHHKMDTKLRKEAFSRLSLLLNKEQMIAEHYPVPGLPMSRYFRFTKRRYEPVTDRSPMFGVDCEWVQCIRGKSGLARVAMVDEHGRTVYHTLVKPHLPVVDYLTKFSGITPELLQGCTTTLRDVQVALQSILPPDAILVGQSLGGDLIAMELMHPYVIDSSVIYNLTGHRRRKSKLALLSQTFLREAIQQSEAGHDPTEDSLAAIKLVNHKLTKHYEYGDVILAPMDEEPTELLKAALEREAMGTKATPASKSASQTDETKETTTNKSDSAVNTSEFVDKHSSLFVKFYDYIALHNKTAFCVATPDAVKLYQPPKRVHESTGAASWESDLVHKAQIMQADDAKRAVSMFQWRLSESYFNMLHTACPSKNEETWKELDNKISSIYQLLNDKGLLICVFAGSRVSGSSNGKTQWQNGATFVKLKVDKSSLPSL